MANSEPVDKIRGITSEVAAKLKESKILNTEQLLKAGNSPEARKGLAKQVGVDPRLLMELLNRADLDRVAGIGGAYANLLEEAGVDTVKELSKRTRRICMPNWSKSIQRRKSPRTRRPCNK